MGDILYDASLWRKWLTKELNAKGVEIDYAGLVETWEGFLVDVYKGRAEYWSQFQAMLKDLKLTAEAAQSMQEQAQDQGRQLAAERKPMPGVPDTLRQLKERGVVLAALSDNESGEAGIRKTLKQLTIEHYFDAVVSSCEIGHVKPEPEAFDHAINATGVEKAECGFVAHDIDELSGAQAHDLFAIGYNYHPNAPADHFIDDFSELLELI